MDISNRSKNTFYWKDYSVYRNALFGLSILSIIVFHYCLDIEQYSTSRLSLYFSIVYSAIIGNGGVDVFVFLSGIGLYNSLKKNPIGKYYINRSTRIMIPYMIVALLYGTIICTITNEKLISYLKNDFSLLPFWLGRGSSYWYVSFIVICYIVYPLLYRIELVSDQKSRYRIKRYVVIITNLLILISALLIPHWYIQTEIALTRVLYFLAGAFVARLVYEKRETKYWGYIYIGIVLRLIVLLIKILNIDFLIRLFDDEFPFNRWIAGWCVIGLFTIFLRCVVIKYGIINKMLAWFGDISFELYLVHISLWHILHKLLGLYKGEIYVFILMIMVSIGLSVMLRHLRVGRRYVNFSDN